MPRWVFACIQLSFGAVLSLPTFAFTEVKYKFDRGGLQLVARETSDFQVCYLPSLLQETIRISERHPTRHGLSSHWLRDLSYVLLPYFSQNQGAPQTPLPQGHVSDKLEEERQTQATQSSRSARNTTDSSDPRPDDSIYASHSSLPYPERPQFHEFGKPILRNWIHGEML